MEAVLRFLYSLPLASLSTDRRQLVARCPFCGDNPSNPSARHFSIKIDMSHNEALVFQCYRPGCPNSTGFLDVDRLQRAGCHDVQALLELSHYNSKVKSIKSDKKFKLKIQREHTTFNPMNNFNKAKMHYFDKRLGHHFDAKEMKKFRMQVSLFDYLNINSIKKLAFKESYCNLIERYGIGFVSTYKDYIIFRDISKDKVLKTKYVNYRTMGTVNEDDKKIYTIPFSIDIMSPEPTVFNVAEGIFSIIGAYLHTDIDKNYKNHIFGAPCGQGYFQFMYHFIRTYGLTKIRVNIFSDSEIELKEYTKIYKQLKKYARIESFKVYYNTKKEDFGYASENISIREYDLTKGGY